MWKLFSPVEIAMSAGKECMPCQLIMCSYLAEAMAIFQNSLHVKVSLQPQKHDNYMY